MADQVTVTGNVGPGLTATAIVITNVTSFRVDTVNSMLYVTGTAGNSGLAREHEFDISDENTVTVTKSGYNWTVTVAA